MRQVVADALKDVSFQTRVPATAHAWSAQNLPTGSAVLRVVLGVGENLRPVAPVCLT